VRANAHLRPRGRDRLDAVLDMRDAPRHVVRVRRRRAHVHRVDAALLQDGLLLGREAHLEAEGLARVVADVVHPLAKGVVEREDLVDLGRAHDVLRDARAAAVLLLLEAHALAVALQEEAARVAVALDRVRVLDAVKARAGRCAVARPVRAAAGDRALGPRAADVLRAGLVDEGLAAEARLGGEHRDRV
jgi:hypothetical protein